MLLYVLPFSLPFPLLYSSCKFDGADAPQLIGLGYALSTSTLFQSFIKIFIGGLRPHFLTICNPINPPSFPGKLTLPTNGLNFYTASQVCTGSDKKVKEAQMSFPSGHSCAAFAGFGFLALYLNAKFKVLSRGGRFRDYYGSSASTEQREVRSGRVHHWKLVLFMAPWCFAMVLALSKIRDGWHHPIDVIFGALVGTLFAHMAYRMVYRSVYDARTNHVPLEGDGGDITKGAQAKEE
jgi:diacylglycerol diphosphate phosphatase/phosphatidate phosphatase